MSIVEEIQDAVKLKKIIIGYKESLKFIKSDSPRLIMMSNNIPESMKKEIMGKKNVSGSRIEIFNGSSKDMGIVCGKPFPVSTVVIEK